MLTHNAQLMPESVYPYTARQSTCRYSAASGVQGLGNFVSVRAGSESDLLTKAAIGPVTVAIDASKQSFMFYSGGYYYEPTCSASNLDHAVLVVGWGSDAAHGDYWIVKNQWGASWGTQGYAIMSRNRDNNCGIASLAVLPCLGSTCPTAPYAVASASPAASSIPAAVSPASNSSPAAGGLPVAPSPAPVATSPSVSPLPPAAASPSPASLALPSTSPAAARNCYCQCGCGDGNPNNICFCPCPCS
jgi:hypothetical protein